ncbi:beta-L-arabinofuranosidase domain-containing protein [Gemmatimonadota bacterium]
MKKLTFVVLSPLPAPAALLALLALPAMLAVPACGPAQRSSGTPQQVSLQAQPLPLSSVRLTGGPLKTAQDLNAAYLLELEPDQMLSYLREHAGLEPKAEGYGGWDGPGRQITGHIAGHYLSGVSLMYAATGDVRFKERADYMVSELREIQDAHGDGYIGAQRDREGREGKAIYEELAQGVIRSSNFDLNGLWSPWYVQHKLFAGLRDAWRFTGNRTALEVEIRFAEWAERILSGLNDDQLQQMLGTEFGGMNEVAADLYADTGDERWLALSDKFQHEFVVAPLSQGTDVLDGLHGNTLVPKLLGSLERYIQSGSRIDGRAARFFWDQVALHHSFATGGHGRNEYFDRPDELNDMVSGRTAETCNVYNMIKMARALFSVEPDIRYADFHERALFNHSLSSIDPEDGRVCYMVPVGNGVQREYQNMFRSFTCCVGSSMESHALHAYGVYYESGDRLWVNLFVPSTAAWEEAGVQVEMSTDFPLGETATLRFALEEPSRFTLALRRPWWAGAGFAARLNGAMITGVPEAGSYLELDRTWQSGDEVQLTLPKTVHTETLPDNPNRAALMWGPLVLAADLGPEGRRGRGAEQEAAGGMDEVPPLVVPEGPVADWLRPAAGRPGTFSTRVAGLEQELEFAPFYRLQRRRYGIYLDVYSTAEWEERLAYEAAEQEMQQRLEAATVAFVEPGSESAEQEFGQQGEETASARSQGRTGLRAAKWFSFELPVDPPHPIGLVVTYSNDESRQRTFDVLVEGSRVGQHTIERRTPEELERFFNLTYSVPSDLLQGRDRFTVRFEATGGNETGAVYGIRVFRADAMPPPPPSPPAPPPIA